MGRVRPLSDDFGLVKSLGGKSRMVRLALMASWRSSMRRFLRARHAATRMRRYSRMASVSFGDGLEGGVVLEDVTGSMGLMMLSLQLIDLT